MKIFVEGELINGFFVNRINRFIAEVCIDGRKEISHVPNTGRMKELLVPGARIILRRVNDPKRKTTLDLLMVYKEDLLVAIDSKLPNSLLDKAFKNREIEGFNQYNQVKREVSFGKSKFDFSLNNTSQNALIEAKCVTLVKDNYLATFPDAPTERGTRHVLELIEAKNQGIRGAVFFIVQREDCNKFTPNVEMDKSFYNAVVMGMERGIEFYAYNCKVAPNYIELMKQLEIEM
ncbi:DNA/RNA nuclease SfsA [Alkaliphilus peptidifermentans]|uniref:Sugar fermentation stimulation protein homolog n=1 Tax=Alkaliphilus peptidifermentans DSM 18978 TaxID=1120976 RepID=A0A1G5KCC9_9FIRM|nr:DNA/RNA nuclease SfsA [Alkaliphilus peptidifermentans]SCY98197.1 sugar fermentation stimulation protein A [Alkaliphilus peptidifermentans DSM 18978]